MNDDDLLRPSLSAPPTGPALAQRTASPALVAVAVSVALAAGCSPGATPPDSGTDANYAPGVDSGPLVFDAGIAPPPDAWAVGVDTGPPEVDGGITPVPDTGPEGHLDAGLTPGVPPEE